MTEDQDVDNYCSELDDENPDVVESQTLGLELRSSPAPCTSSYVIVVAMEYGSHC